MPAITSFTSSTTVLVSGANGFVGTWIVDTLLKRGYKVRAAVRAEARGTHLLEKFKAYGDKLQLCVVGDIVKVRVDTRKGKDENADGMMC